MPFTLTTSTAAPMAFVRTALLIAFLLVTRAAPSNNPPAPAPQSEGEENPYTGEGEGEDYSPEPAHPPEVPNPSWPPSWPPSPPQLPGYCADTCETANDGVCDELSGQSEETASYRSEFAGDPDLDPFGSLDDGWSYYDDDPSICADGTDCTDCGQAATFCYDCPSSCSKLALLKPAQACLQSMWNDNVCNDECNNFACGHNDCTFSQIKSMCVPSAEKVKGVMSSTSSNNDTLSDGDVSVAMTFNISSPLVMEQDTARSLMLVTFEVQTQLQWQVSNHCWHIVH
uniref:Uncharacterized protein n=1 Tax=Chrysotila carterae TaxID=13221 RepID=A0A7S4B3Z8_CHRCT|mmetsp:Transcript_46493/g.100994  ORF Transcript_46493/g.100994 Transcript_46493/m.100994 type:complete len:285 (+) Transcript_46493:74-928(+)